MTKEEVVNQIAISTGVNKKVVLPIIGEFMKTVQDSLEKKENIHLRGFGSFIIKHKIQKQARNISNNTVIIVPAHDAPAFKPSKEFLDRITK
jgi:DNA-binding protein HU-beta